MFNHTSLQYYIKEQVSKISRCHLEILYKFSASDRRSIDFLDYQIVWTQDRVNEFLDMSLKIIFDVWNTFELYVAYKH